MSSRWFSILALLIFACFFLTTNGARFSPQMKFISGPVVPGVYRLNLNSPISNATSSPFLITSSVEMNVTVSPTTIPNTTYVALTWSAYLGAPYVAFLNLSSITDPSLTFTIVAVSDTGFARVPFYLFGPHVPEGSYIINVTNSLAIGGSNIFNLTSFPLNVTLSNYSVPINTQVTVNWEPSDQTTPPSSIYLTRIYNGTTYIISTTAINNGSYIIDLTGYPAGSYFVSVKSSQGAGSSSLLEITSAVTLLVTPPSVNINGTALITWSPYDPSQLLVSLAIYNLTNFTILSVPNNGFYQLSPGALGLEVGDYNVSLQSEIGNATSSFTVYTDLVVSQPNSSSIYYNDTTLIFVEWAPSSVFTDDVLISFVNLNTNGTFNTTAINNGSAWVNVTQWNLTTSPYVVNVFSRIGNGTSAIFLINTTYSMVIYTPNNMTIVSNSSSLLVTWGVTYASGPNATIWLYSSTDPSIRYGPFSVINNGSALIPLANLTLSATKKITPKKVLPKYSPSERRIKVKT